MPKERKGDDTDRRDEWMDLHFNCLLSLQVKQEPGPNLNVGVRSRVLCHWYFKGRAKTNIYSRNCLGLVSWWLAMWPTGEEGAGKLGGDSSSILQSWHRGWAFLTQQRPARHQTGSTNWNFGCFIWWSHTSLNFLRTTQLTCGSTATWKQQVWVSSPTLN